MLDGHILMIRALIRPDELAHIAKADTYVVNAEDN